MRVVKQPGAIAVVPHPNQSVQCVRAGRVGSNPEAPPQPPIRLGVATPDRARCAKTRHRRTQNRSHANQGSSRDRHRRLSCYARTSRGVFATANLVLRRAAR